MRSIAKGEYIFDNFKIFKTIDESAVFGRHICGNWLKPFQIKQPLHYMYDLERFYWDADIFESLYKYPYTQAVCECKIYQTFAYYCGYYYREINLFLRGGITNIGNGEVLIREYSDSDYTRYMNMINIINTEIKKSVIDENIVVFRTTEGAKASVEKARKELDIDIIDIFMLHEQESRLTLRGHRDALEYYISVREKGIIKAVGVSAHNIEVVEACADMLGIDVIHPLINKTRIGDGTIEDMLVAVKRAHDNGKGIYGMKPLGGGNLLNSAAKRTKHLHIDFWCEGCGKYVERCRQDALCLHDGKVTVKADKCLLCVYCASVCPCFAIKVC